jgi:molybdopterin molybdotransferase
VDRNGGRVTMRVVPSIGDNVRPKGGDFDAGTELFAPGRQLTSRDLMLAASAGWTTLPLRRQPTVAILATGDELVAPGQIPGAGQIVSSIPHGLAALVVRAGGSPRLLGIARDTLDDLDEKIGAAADADILVTIGGASVGDHDLVNKALTARGLDLDFWRIAMRPGKPLMFGNLGAQRVLGLPGNPVSATLCAYIFLVPLIHALLGRQSSGSMTTRAITVDALPENGPRKHFVRAIYARGPDTTTELPVRVRALEPQDSSLLSVLAAADCLIIRPIDAPAVAAGGEVTIQPLDF